MGSVLLIGDSNIRLGATAITTTFGFADLVACFMARGGTGIRGYAPSMGGGEPDFWKDRVQALTFTPDAIVVELGVNDTLEPGTFTTTGYGQYGMKIGWLFAYLPDVPVYWSNLPVSLLAANRQTGAKAVNAALKLSAQLQPDLTVIDWNVEAAGHSEYMKPDGVHLTSAGYDAYAALVVDSL